MLDVTTSLSLVLLVEVLLSEIKGIATPWDSSLFLHQLRERWTWSQETWLLELARATSTLGHVMPAAPISQGGEIK